MPRPMLNYFWLRPTTLAYVANVLDGDNQSSLVFPQLNGDSRAAIIGMMSAPNALVIYNECQRVKVANRDYLYGDAIGAGSIVASVRAAVNDVTTPTRHIPGAPPYFPGSPDALPLGPRGERIAAIPVRGGEQINLKFQDMTAGSGAMTDLALLMVEFPAGDPGADAMWEALTSGIGTLQMIGNKVSYSGALSNSRKTVRLRGPNPRRRLDVRGYVLNSASSYAYDETALALVSLNVLTDKQLANMSAAIRAQDLLAHAGYYGFGTMVDMMAETESYIDVNSTTPGGNRVLYLASMFEGLPLQERFTPTYQAPNCI